MKNLPNERFSFPGCVVNTSIFTKVDFEILNKIRSPKSLVVRTGFSSELSVGLYTNVIKLVTELMTLGSGRFVSYVKDFANHYDLELALVSKLDEELKSTVLNLASIDNNDIDQMLAILSRNRKEFLEFIEALKLNRPKEVSAKFNSFKELYNSDYRFYISYIEMSVTEQINPSIYPLDSQVLVGSFNLDFPFNVPENYKEHLKGVAEKVDSFGIGFAIESVVENFKNSNNSIFDPSTFNLMIYSLPMIYSALYDILYFKIRGLVKFDVNEG